MARKQQLCLLFCRPMWQCSYVDWALAMKEYSVRRMREDLLCSRVVEERM